GRSWTDTSTGQKVDGEFQRVTHGKVVIKTGQKSFVQIPLGKLSKEDRDFINKQTQGRGQGEQAPPKKPAEPEAAKDIKAADKDKMIIVVIEINGKKGAMKLSPERKWTDSQGRSVQARFIGMDKDGKVVLFYKDKPSLFPLENFSKDDQDYVRKEMVA